MLCGKETHSVTVSTNGDFCRIAAGLRQYSLIRGDISTGRQYYRCTRCAEWKKKRSEGKIAYISVVKGRIVSQSGAHHPSCEPLDENKVFAKAVDRQCRLDVRKEGTNPRLSYTKGSGQTPSPSPTTSDSQGTVDGRVTEVIHGENGAHLFKRVGVETIGRALERIVDPTFSARQSVNALGKVSQDAP
ncbi:unnamed protein product [Toxocara canis]|uniref:FLYWCH-type domain-containing protein n=1 Tax=Toxocara canis TaxID=6265 RepID=A0A183U469_TOXCA|nr:unnamed protein product [Toxocara canis]